MHRVVLRRLLYVVPVMVAISLIVFGLLHLAPGDPAFVLAGEDAAPADIQQIRVNLGLNKPLYVQYGLWASRVVRGDLGRSIITRRPVITEIRSRIWPTTELATAAMVLATVLGVIIGVVSATYQYSFVDHVAMVGALLGVSLPIFWVGLMMIFLFSVELRWFPTGGAAGIRALVLPALALGAASVAIIARMTRSSLLEVIRQDFTRTARAKGLSVRAVIFRHALRNALVPVVTVISLQFGYLLGGAVVTETVFSRPGLGRMLVDAIRSRDFPVVQGGLMILGAAFVVMNAAVDVLYAYLDPRVRYD
ncbi:MAG TPA: ABC transporter permease [bacterium]|nr:ABC transporter permease [bacterium]